ncbi:MAG: acyl-CoA dehydrogenase family protein [Geodermatophilaceae bacterium]
MSAELEAFSDSVRQLLAHHALPDDWKPGIAADDQHSSLTAALTDVGWSELRDGGVEARPFLGAGAVEMGRAVAPFCEVVSVLGGSPLVDGLAMYVGSCANVAVPGPGGYTLSTVRASRAVNFADSLDVRLVSATAAPVDVNEPFERIAAWETATLGYLAGLADGAVSRAVAHSRDRQVFGNALAQIETVQQRLADAATVSDALVLSAREGASGLPALAHATANIGSVMTHCHQVFGAIGFTLEFPMQRYSRRAKALAAFTNAWIDQRLEFAG